MIYITKKKRALAILVAMLVSIGCLTASFSFAALSNGQKGESRVVNLGASKDGKYYYNPHYKSVRQFKYTVKVSGKSYIGYCLTPSKDFSNSKAYTIKNYKSSSAYKALSAAKQKLLTVAMIYGYNSGKSAPYGNGNDYYAATQTIVREIVEGDLKFSGGKWTHSGTGEYKMIKGRDYAVKCYNKIKKDVAGHLEGASFTKTSKSSATTYTMKYNYSSKKWSVTLKDSNAANYLKKLSGSSSGLSMSRSGHSYTFSATKAGTYTAELGNSISTGTSQAMMVLQPSSSSYQSIVLGATDETEFYVKLKTEGIGTAKIIKTSGSGKLDGFRFNITCSGNGYSGSFVTNTSGLITVSLYPGKYVVQEVLTPAQKAEGYEQAAAKTINVVGGTTATVNIHNAYTDPKPGLKIFKDTTDGGSLEGFSFRIEGIHFNSKTLTAANVLSGADPQVTALDDYEISSWEVDTEDLKKINNAAKEGKIGVYQVRLKNNASLKETPIEPTVSSDSGIETDGENPSEPTEPSQPTDPKPEHIDLETSVSINLTHVEEPVKEKNSRTDGNITFNDFGWSGSATVLSLTRTTNVVGVISLSSLEFGRYTITEIMSDKQEDRYHEPQPQTVTLTEDNPSAAVSVTYKNKARVADLKIKKTSVDGKISDIQFTITGKTAWGEEIQPITAVTDDEGYINIKKMAAGEYTIQETNLDPEVYVPQEPQTITITGDETEPIEVFFENIPYTDVEISKQSETTGEELPGATMQVLDKESGEVIEEWTSSDEPHVVQNLEYGKEYILHEDLAPLGYACAQDITFVAGDTDKVTMVDEVSKLFITKIDAETGLYLPGATYEVSDPETSELVATFTTEPTESNDGTCAYVEISGMEEGKKYVVHEVQAPDGYSLGEDQEIIFENGMTVAMGNLENGTVVITSEDEINRMQRRISGEGFENGSETQTGDDTSILPYILLSFTGAVTAGIIWYRRKDKGELFK